MAVRIPKALLIVVVLLLVAAGAACGGDNETPDGRADSDGEGLSPSSPGWGECVERFDANACREGMTAAERLSNRYGEYTCYGRSLIDQIEDAEDEADEADRPRVASKVEVRDWRRRLDGLKAELDSIDRDESQAGVDAFNAKVDEHNAALASARRALRRNNRLTRRSNRFVNVYNGLLENECEKD